MLFIMHLSHLLVALCILALASGQEQLLMVFGGLNVYIRPSEERHPSLFGRWSAGSRVSSKSQPSTKAAVQRMPGSTWRGQVKFRLYTAPCSLVFLKAVFFGTGKLPHVCGGRYWEGNSEGLDNFANDKCYIYEPGKSNIPYTVVNNICEEISTPQRLIPGQSLGS